VLLEGVEGEAWASLQPHGAHGTHTHTHHKA
jgi:hypothetical protein